MRQQLLNLGLSEKEVEVYLALLEFGTQPASVIARKIGLPRPTALFHCRQLFEKGYVRKTKQGKAQLFYVEIEDLKMKLSLKKLLFSFTSKIIFFT